MLFTTLHQFGIFLAFVWLGAILSAIYLIIKPHKTVLKNVFDFIYIMISGILFILFMHIYNLGNFRLFLVFGIIVGYIITQFFISKTLAHLNFLLYNYINSKYLSFKNNCFNKNKTKQNRNLNNKHFIKLKKINFFKKKQTK